MEASRRISCDRVCLSVIRFGFKLDKFVASLILLYSLLAIARDIEAELPEQLRNAVQSSNSKIEQLAQLKSGKLRVSERVSTFSSIQLTN